MKPLSKLQLGLLHSKQSRAPVLVGLLHVNKAVSQLEQVGILIVIKGEIFYTQRDSPPQINCKLTFSLLQSFFSSCKSMRRRHQNRYPHAEIRKTRIEAQSQWCSFYTSDLPRVQILSFSPLPPPDPEVISFNPVVLNAIYMVKMLEVTAPN